MVNNHYDHIIRGKSLIHFVMPPKFPTTEELEWMKDGLFEVIPNKLKVLLDRAKNLKHIRDKKLAILAKETYSLEFSRFFWSSFIFHEFEEYYVIQKWITYWLNIWHRAIDSVLPRKLRSELNKIEDWEIDKAKQRPFQDLCESPIIKAGRNLKTNCPFHQDKTPSFFIYPGNNAHCFGCSWHGDVIKFYMETRNLSFPDAVRALL